MRRGTHWLNWSCSSVQSKRSSLAEAGINVVLGYVISLGVQLVVYPAFGHSFTFSQNLWLGGVFAIVSLIRGYVVRRWFNQYIHRLALKV